MASVVKSFAIAGVDAYIVDIETDTMFGQPSVMIVGLGDAAVKEARERIQASIIHSGYEFPKMKIVFNLAPGDIKKSGSHFDLAMAVGLLLQSGQISFKDTGSLGFIGELSLNAELRPCTGVLPMAIEAKRAGIINLIVPSDNVREASLVSGINIYGFNSLIDAIHYMEGANPYSRPDDYKDNHTKNRKYMMDFNEVQGQDAAIEYVVAADAGAQSMMLLNIETEYQDRYWIE